MVLCLTVLYSLCHLPASFININTKIILRIILSSFFILVQSDIGCMLTCVMDYHEVRKIIYRQLTWMDDVWGMTRRCCQWSRMNGSNKTKLNCVGILSYYFYVRICVIIYSTRLMRRYFLNVKWRTHTQNIEHLRDQSVWPFRLQMTCERIFWISK